MRGIGTYVLPTAAAGSAAALFGLYSVFVAAVVTSPSGLSPLVFATYRDFAATIILMSAAAVWARRTPVQERRFIPEARHLPRWLLLGFTAVWGSQGMSAVAISKSSPVFFTSWQQIVPVLAMAASLMLGYEVANVRALSFWLKVCGILLSVASSICLVVFTAGTSHNGGSVEPYGIMATLIQISSSTTYLVVSKPLMRYYPALVVTAWSYAIGFSYLVASALTSATSADMWTTNGEGAGAIIFSAFFASAYCWWAMSWATAAVSPAFTTAFTPLQTIVAAIVSHFWLGKQLTLWNYIGGAGIALGLFIMLAGKAMEGPPPLPPPTDAKHCSIQGGEQDERRTSGGRDDDGEVELEREPHDDDAVADRQALTRTPLAQPAWMSGVATEDGLVHHRAKLLP